MAWEAAQFVQNKTILTNTCLGQKNEMHQLSVVQILPVSLQEAWEFFSSPANLSKITPPALTLTPTCEIPEKMYPGMIVLYKVRPFLGIPFTWVTEITHVRAGEYFVDEQRIGPYRLWHHEHHFKPVPGGVEMRDLVSYRLPFGWLGKLLHGLFVRRQLEGIFSYRRERLKEIFG